MLILLIKAGFVSVFDKIDFNIEQYINKLGVNSIVIFMCNCRHSISLETIDFCNKRMIVTTFL